MPIRFSDLVRTMCLIAILGAASTAGANSAASWNGMLRDDAGKAVGEATVTLRAPSGDRYYSATTSSDGRFVLAGIVAGDYRLSVEAAGKTWDVATPVTLKDGATLTSTLQLSSLKAELRVLPSGD